MADAKKEITKKQADDHDVVLVHGRTEDGLGLKALRSRPKKLEFAEIRPIKEGQPIGGREVVQLRPREESPLLYDVNTVYHNEETGELVVDSSRSGPPKVASRSYRENWDAVFGKRRRRKPVLN